MHMGVYIFFHLYFNKTISQLHLVHIKYRNLKFYLLYDYVYFLIDYLFIQLVFL